MTRGVLVDEKARLAIRGALDRTLVVEAAAGTGKTTELVQRIVAVVQSGRGTLSSIIAVTFTEKAAGEMKLRIRTELDRALLSAGLPELEQSRLRVALSELEAAKIGTIHALCADLLREHPVEAGVDPAFEVADAQRSRALLERAFDRWFERVLDAPPEGVRRVLQRRLVSDRERGAREQLFMAASRLVETRDFDTPYRREPVDRRALIDGAVAQLTDLARFAERGSSPKDPLKRALGRLAQRLKRARGLDHDALEELLRLLLRDRDIFNDTKGRGDWYGPGLARSDVLAARTHAKTVLESCVRELSADLAACLSRELLPVVTAYEQEKAAQGTLDFFDLLLSTRDLFRNAALVRQEVQRRITHVFVDEFQDTDPVQSEILMLVSADDPDERDPWRARPIPGKLFVVGDPKQSIYRFRRADVSLYERVKRHLMSVGAEVLELSTSFRSLPGIQSLVNASFEPLMGGRADLGQASYVPLSPFREARADQPAVVALPAPKPYGSSGRVTKTAINQCLPDAVAAFIDWLVHKSGYRVLDGGRDVPLEARHVCLLFRRFRAFDGDVTREYVRALEARRIPHVLSGGRSFHSREEVIALRAVLSAIEWPDDALHVYATLRGPFVAFTDEALLSFKTKVRHLHPLGPVDATLLDETEREIAEVLSLLRKLHRGRNRRPVADTLSMLLSELRAHAGIAIWPTGEQALGNVLRVLDFARSYERRGHASSFRGFVEWLDRHAEIAETADAPVIEESSDGVRIMTVHAAKGLEFPVVVLCDPTAPRRPEFASRYIDAERKLWAQALCDAEPHELIEQRERVRDHDEAELVRLSYVAATRAKEMLVVPTCGDQAIDGWVDVFTPALYPAREHRRSPKGPGPRCPRFAGDSVVAWPVRAERSPEDSVAPGEHEPAAGEHRVVWWDPNVLDLQRPAAGGLTQQDLLRADERGGRDERSLLAHRAWSERNAALRERASVPSLVVRPITQVANEGAPGATSVALDVLDTGVDRASRPSGPRFGTLVHALLEHAALDRDGEDLTPLARAIGRTLLATPAEIARAVVDAQVALRHPVFARMREAHARGELFRETPVSLRAEDGTLLEGVVDAAYREHEDGQSRMVIVDFKTDVELGDLSVYARQLALYADALSRALGESVRTLLLRV